MPYGKIRQQLRETLHELAKLRERESEILEGRLRLDHVPMLIRISSKYSVSHVAGCIKGKSAIRVAQIS